MMRRILFGIAGAVILALSMAVIPATVSQAQVKSYVCPAYPISGYQFSNGTCPKSSSADNNKPTLQGLLNDDYYNQDNVQDLQNQLAKLENQQNETINFGIGIGAFGILAALCMLVAWSPWQRSLKIPEANNPTKNASE